MKLSDVLANLDRTIEGKEILLSSLSAGSKPQAFMQGVLKINLEELRNIRADIVKVMEDPLI